MVSERETPLDLYSLIGGGTDENQPDFSEITWHAGCVEERAFGL